MGGHFFHNFCTVFLFLTFTKAERTSRRKIEVLLEKLKTRDDKYYSIFRCEVAREQPQCAEQCLPPSDDNLPFPKEEQTPTTSKTLDAI